jgi:hypothetical protein
MNGNPRRMKRVWRNTALLVVAAWVLSTTVFAAADTTQPTISDSQVKELAKAVTMITGIAISPLLGVGAVGCYDWIVAKTPAQKAKLPWYAQVYFWLPALLLIGVVAAKDALGTVLPPGLKKPFDVAEVVENKISGLVALGAVVPSIAAVFQSTVASGTQAHLGLASAGLATIDFMPLLNILTVPLAMAAFVFVWLLGHVVNVLILISPFGVVDATLKSARTLLLALLVIVYKINPVWGAVLSLSIIVCAYFVAGWSFRLMIYGSVYTWDFVTGRRKGFTPVPNANWMFTARRIEKTPIRTFGKLVRNDKGQLAFEYRPWLFMQKQTQPLPEAKYAVRRGLFYPDVLLVEGQKAKSLLTMPPRYKTHEEEVAQIYSITDIRDTSLLKGIKAIWRWFTRNLFGEDSKEATAAGVVV